MPFDRLKLSVLKYSSSVRTVRVIRSRKFISRSNAQAIHSKKIIICSNGSSYPFKKIHPVFERFELSVQKNPSSAQTPQAIRSKKLIRSNGSSYPSGKFISRSNGSSYLIKKTSYFGSLSNKTRLQNNSPRFVK